MSTRLDYSLILILSWMTNYIYNRGVLTAKIKELIVTHSINYLKFSRLTCATRLIY